jgi:hypothetical protein
MIHQHQLFDRSPKLSSSNISWQSIIPGLHSLFIPQCYREQLIPLHLIHNSSFLNCIHCSFHNVIENNSFRCISSQSIIPGLYSLFIPQCYWEQLIPLHLIHNYFRIGSSSVFYHCWNDRAFIGFHLLSWLVGLLAVSVVVRIDVIDCIEVNWLWEVWNMFLRVEDEYEDFLEEWLVLVMSSEMCTKDDLDDDGIGEIVVEFAAVRRLM